MNPEQSNRDFPSTADRESTDRGSNQAPGSSLPLPQTSSSLNMMSQQGMTNNYQLYIQAPPTSHMNMYYEATADDSASKKRRTNYKNPENSAKLNAAINMLINQLDDASGHKDLKSISKMFNIPYNTLRDNYLKATTGQAPKSKRKHAETASSSQPVNHEVQHIPMPHGQMQYMPPGYPSMLHQLQLQQQLQQQQHQQQNPHQQLQQQQLQQQIQQQHHQQQQQHQQKLQQQMMSGNIDPTLLPHVMNSVSSSGNIGLQHNQQLPTHPQLSPMSQMMHHQMYQQQHQLQQHNQLQGPPPRQAPSPSIISSTHVSEVKVNSTIGGGSSVKNEVEVVPTKSESKVYEVSSESETES